MEQKTSSFDRVLGAWDILVIAFGAMIGWGWVVSTGTWIRFKIYASWLAVAVGLVLTGPEILALRTARDSSRPSRSSPTMRATTS